MNDSTNNQNNLPTGNSDGWDRPPTDASHFPDYCDTSYWLDVHRQKSSTEQPASPSSGILPEPEGLLSDAPRHNPIPPLPSNHPAYSPGYGTYSDTAMYEQMRQQQLAHRQRMEQMRLHQAQMMQQQQEMMLMQRQQSMFDAHQQAHALDPNYDRAEINAIAHDPELLKEHFRFERELKCIGEQAKLDVRSRSIFTNQGMKCNIPPMGTNPDYKTSYDIGSMF